MGDVARRLPEAGEGAGHRLGRHATEPEHVRHAADGVGAPAEPDEEDTIPGLLVVDDEIVALGDAGCDPVREGAFVAGKGNHVPGHPVADRRVPIRVDDPEV